MDVFLSKFDSEGKFQWVRTWGGKDWDIGYGVAADDSGSLYVAGNFEGTVDFDPGPGVDDHSSNGSDAAFLSKFDSEGNLQWARTWGESSGGTSFAVATDGSGSIYVVGYFWDTVDFDPGPGIDEHNSNGICCDAFVSKFDSEGNFQWARTWGGVGWDAGYGVATDGSGSVYVTGYFLDVADFDPGFGIDEHTSNGEYDAFLSKFPPDGNW
jgi:hypothetical protein